MAEHMVRHVKRVGVIACLIVLLGSTSASASEPSLTFGSSGSGSGQFVQPSGLTVDEHGNVYVADRDNRRIQKFSADGQFLLAFGSAGSAPTHFSLPVDIASDQHGNLFIADAMSGTVKRYTDQGVFVWATPVLPGEPWFVAVAPSGIYVQITNASTIVKLDPSSGTPVASFSRPDTANGGLAATADGSILVVDSEARQIVRMRPDGTFTGAFAALPTHSGNWHVAVDPAGSVYVELACQGTSAGSIGRFAPTGVPAGAWAEPPYPNGCITGLAVSPDGRYVYAAHNQGAFVERVDTHAAAVAITVAPSAVLTGVPFVVGAAGTVPFAALSLFEWGVDAPGSYLSGTASTGVQTLALATPGVHLLDVRATSPDGFPAFASIVVTAYPSPPTGETGVSINGGAKFTNSPNVTVRLNWPAFATSARFSNDGGFASVVASNVAPALSWTLDSSGPERLPKTIYARFDGLGIDTAKTFTDDIILDETPPTLAASATAQPSSGLTALRFQKGRKVTVSLLAKDQVSGVVSVQLSVSRARPGAVRRYARKTILTTTANTLYARAQDRAGNWSPWKRILVKKVKATPKSKGR